MIFYFALFLLFFLLSFLDIENVKTSVKTRFYILSILLLIVLSGLRWKTGTDWDMYYYYFTTYKSFDEFNNGQFEFLYSSYAYIIKSLTNSYSVFLLVTSIFIIGFKAIMFRKLEPYFLVCLFAFYAIYMGDLFPVRQNIAISIALLSFYFIIKRQKLAFVISVIVATFFHNSAIILLAAYPIFYMKMSNKLILILIATSLLIGLSDVLTSALRELKGLFNLGGGFLSERITDKLQSYTTDSYSSNISSNVAFLISAARRLIILPIVLYLRKDIKSTVFNGYINLFVFSNIIFFLLSKVSIVFVRFTSYFALAEILMIAIVLRSQKDKRIKVLLLIFFAIYLAIRLIVSINTYRDLFDPYYWIFDKYIPRITY